jgi:hypothetical protein
MSNTLLLTSVHRQPRASAAETFDLQTFDPPKTKTPALMMLRTSVPVVPPRLAARWSGPLLRREQQAMLPGASVALTGDDSGRIYWDRAAVRWVGGSGRMLGGSGAVRFAPGADSLNGRSSLRVSVIAGFFDCHNNNRPWTRGQPNQAYCESKPSALHASRPRVTSRDQPAPPRCRRRA